MDNSPYPLTHRVTCAVREILGDETLEEISRLGVRHILTQSARSVRRRRRKRRFGPLGYIERLDNSPVDIYQFRVGPEQSAEAIAHLAKALDMRIPSRGTIYAEEVQTLAGSPGNIDAPSTVNTARPIGLLQDLSLITCIMSRSGSGEELAKVALELGTGVPIVTLGAGTGLRDRLGLLRITVPPEKELVHLLAPAADTEGLIRVLVEKGRLNRPGRGFVYSTPVRHGILDTSVTIGPREHAASMEQIIAAIDDLKRSAAWRRRFLEHDPDAGIRLERGGSAITLICGEEHSRKYSQAALHAGAAGATIADVQCLAMGDSPGGARERCTIVVRQPIVERVLDALLSVLENDADGLECLEVQPVPATFSYHAIPGRT